MGIFDSIFGKKEKPTDLICDYSVVYKGGHPDYPKSKNGMIDFYTCSDRFEFSPTMGSKDWFKGLVIPFNTVIDLQIVQRQVGTVEGLLGGLDSRQLNQANNIHITYNSNGQEVVLRLEMLSGVTVMGQAQKCLEFEDRLRTNSVRSKFSQKTISTNGTVSSELDIPSQIEKLASLMEKGFLTKTEFETKKAELLAKM
ncbi:MAG: hypothetical protein RL266_2206 [Bacteroidota bacterium]